MNYKNCNETPESCREDIGWATMNSYFLKRKRVPRFATYGAVADKESPKASSYTIPPSGPVSTASTIMLSSVEKARVGSGKTAVVAGATGYIGKAVVQECVARGYQTIALVRDKSKLMMKDGLTMDPNYAPYLKGAKLVNANVEDFNELKCLLEQFDNIDVLACCLASATGVKEYAERIDYQASLNFLNAGRAIGARHYVLLSAFCVRRPLLELQRQKLRFEAELAAQTEMTYTIVRPTAFFKSVSGQLESIQNKGAPYVLFGDGAVTKCNPIAEEDLAYYMMDSAINDDKRNKILNIGGPDQPLTNQMLGQMMYKAIGKEAKFVYVPTWIFDMSIGMIEYMANNFLPNDQKWQDVLETAKIGKYYAVEDMLTTDPAEKFGTITMQEHYNKIATKGQDPFTPVRATAVIARVFELGPLLLASSIPMGAFALAAGASESDPEITTNALRLVLKEWAAWMNKIN